MPSAEHAVSRRLAAIVVADVVGYTRLMERDEAGTHARLKEIRAQVVDPRIAAHGGRIIHTSGDGMLVEFGSATAALRCATEIQREMGTRNLYVAPDERIEFRIGINLGDIIVDGDDIAGEGVNVAARLETLAEPGGICIAATVLEHAHEDLGIGFVDIGEQQVKNIIRPIRVYRVTLGKVDKAARYAEPTVPEKRSRRLRWFVTGVAILGAIAVGGVLVQQWLKSSAFSAPPSNSVAILPVTAPANSPAEEQLADVITQDLTTALGRSRMTHVASPRLAAAYKGRSVEVHAAGRELNVRYLAEGGVRTDSDRDVVTIRLVDAVSGVQLWSDQYEVRKSPEKEERAILVMRMARRLGNALYDAQRIDPNQSLAMKLFFRADNINDLTSREAIMEARRLYDDAIRLEPDLTVALIGRGWNSVAELELDSGQDRDRLVDETLGFSARALAIDPDDARAWDLRGVGLGWQGRFGAAFEAAARARQFEPALNYNVHIWLLVMNGEADEALAFVERAFSVDPQSIGNYQFQKCWASLQLGRYETAIAACEKWLSVNNYWFTHVLLTAAYAQSGNAAKAAAEKAIVLQRTPAYSIARYKALWKSDSPAYQEQTEAHIFAGLRKAGIPDK